MAWQRVLGVIDVLDGCAVHAVAGRRGEYRPHLHSARSSPDPLALAEIYRQGGVGGLYLADLNAITGSESQIGLLRDLAAGDLPVWIDAGIRSLQDWREKRAQWDGVDVHWILATETFAERLPDLPEVSSIEEAAALTVGIDLQAGRVRGPATISADPLDVAAQPSPQTIDRSALAVVEDWVRRGIRSFLPLEITSVGVAQGPATATLCRQIRQKFPDVELLSGGGVRNHDDLQRLLDAGCDRVLVATALINGSIPPRGLQPQGNKS